MIKSEDIKKLKEISKKVFLKNIGTYPLIVKLNKWIEIFDKEIKALKERIKILEAEVELLRKSRSGDLGQQQTPTLENESTKPNIEQCSITPEIVRQTREAFACSIDQMAKVLEISPKYYLNIERGNITPSLALETKILKLRYMSAMERREILQAHGLFRTRNKKRVTPSIPNPPDTPEIRMTIGELEEIKERLDVSVPQLAKLINENPGKVANWFWRGIQPGEEQCQKLRALSLEQVKKLPTWKSPLRTIPSNESISPENISLILKRLNWTTPQLAAYLHVAEYKVWNWKSGHSSPTTRQANKLKELQDKIKINDLNKIPTTINKFKDIKEKLKYSDYHLSIILKIPFTKVHSWSLGVNVPTLNESAKIKRLHSEIFSGKFVDNTQLPRISPEKIKELRKRQKLTLKDFLRLMGVQMNTYERWRRGKKGPTAEENERLWILWEKTAVISPPVLSAAEIFNLRKSRNLTQKEFGKMIGLNRGKVSRLELGSVRTSIEINNEIHRVFNLVAEENFDNER